MKGIRAGPPSVMIMNRMQPDESQPPAMLDYAPPPAASARRLRIAALLAVSEGVAVGVLLALYPSAFRIMLVLLLCIGLPLHLGILARRHRIIIGLVFAASLAGAVSAEAVSSVLTRVHLGLGWATLYFARGFGIVFCIAGALSLISSVPLALIARRAKTQITGR